MKTEAGEKAFDCVKWTRRTRDRISTEIRDMSQEELVREAAANLPETYPPADDREGASTIPMESNPHLTERDMMREAIS